MHEDDPQELTYAQVVRAAARNPVKTSSNTSTENEIQKQLLN